MADNDEKTEQVPFKTITSLAIGAGILVSGAFVLRFWDVGFSTSSEHWGQFGDYIGGLLNPVFSFAALVALLWTIRLQSAELRLSRKELELTRSELESSTKALVNQEKTQDNQYKQMRIESFESTFFKLISQLDETSRALEELHSQKISLFSRISSGYHRSQQAILMGVATQDAKIISDSTATFNSKYRPLLLQIKQYIRQLENILSYIRRQWYVIDVSFYINCITTQFSEQQLVAIFVYVQCNREDNEDLFKLIEHFSLFRDLEKMHWAYEHEETVYAQLGWSHLHENAFVFNEPHKFFR